MFDTMLESTTAKDEGHSKWSFPIAIGAHVLVVGLILGVSYLIVQAVQDPDLVPDPERETAGKKQNQS